eukprot:1156149-Pelagomonas_calceolata.AAC.7
MPPDAGSQRSNSNNLIRTPHADQCHCTWKDPSWSTGPLMLAANRVEQQQPVKEPSCVPMPPHMTRSLKEHRSPDVKAASTKYHELTNATAPGRIPHGAQAPQCRQPGALTATACSPGSQTAPLAAWHNGVICCVSTTSTDSNSM